MSRLCRVGLSAATPRSLTTSSTGSRPLTGDGSSPSTFRQSNAVGFPLQSLTQPASTSTISSYTTTLQLQQIYSNLHQTNTMQTLNLPAAPLRIDTANKKPRIFDVIRKKFVVLTPEEWVRQHFIHLLINLNYPQALIAVEKLVLVNQLRQRADIVVYNRQGKPALIVECKAPEVPLSNVTIQQAGRYNTRLGVNHIIITNGLSTYCLFIHPRTHQSRVLSEIPTFETLNAPPF